MAHDLGISPTTVQKWRNRKSTADAPRGPRRMAKPLLSPGEEALVVLFRWRSLLSLDDCLQVLRALIPHLKRSSLHRCLARHGIAGPPHATPVSPAAKAAVGWLRVTLTELPAPDGPIWLIAMIDHTSRYLLADLCEPLHVHRTFARLLAAAPYPVKSIIWQDRRHFHYPLSVAEALSGATKLDDGAELAKMPRLPRTSEFSPWRDLDVERIDETMRLACQEHSALRISRLRGLVARHVHRFNHAAALRALSGSTPAQYLAQAPKQ